MKWFKYISGSLNDQDIYEAIEQFGSDAYLVFFGVIDLMAQEFDIHNPGVSTFSYKYLMKNLQISRRKLTEILNFFEKKVQKKSKIPRFIIKYNKNTITINCPKLKSLCDEYTEKLLKKEENISGEYPDNNREFVGHIEEEEETEVRSKKKDIKRNQETSVVDMVIEEEKSTDEESSFLTENEIQKEQEEKSRLNQIVLKLTTALFRNGKRFYNLNMFLQSHNRSRIIVLIDTLESLYAKRETIDNPKMYAESIFKNKNSAIIKAEADAECEKHKSLTKSRRAEIYG